MVSIYSGPLLAMATRTAFPAIIYPAMTGSAMPSAYSFSYWLVAAPLREQVCANVCLNGPTIVSSLTATAPIVYNTAKTVVNKVVEVTAEIKKSHSWPSFFTTPKEAEASESKEAKLKEEMSPNTQAL